MALNRNITTVKGAMAEIRPLVKPRGEAQLETPEEFKNNRFEYYADTHQRAVIAGSTYMSIRTPEEPNQSILDAAQTRDLVDADGVRVGFTMAIADGLGHGIDKENNEEISYAAGFLCNDFNNRMSEQHAQSALSDVQLEEQVKQGILASARAYSPMSPDKKMWTKEASLTTAVAKRLVPPEENQLECSIASVGDSMVVVVDSQTRKVKAVVSAKKYANRAEEAKGAVTYDPVSAQRATEEQVESVPVTLRDDDIIIEMTDGIWDALQHAPQLSETKDAAGVSLYEESQLDTQAFEAILANIQDKDWNAYGIAQAVQNAALETTLAERQSIQEFLQKVTPEHTNTLSMLREKHKVRTQEDDLKLTVQMWLDACKERELPDISNSVKEFMQNSRGIIYPRGLDTPASGLLEHHISRIQMGDCATISVTQAPNRKVELVRALLNPPEDISNLASRLQKLRDSELQAKPGSGQWTDRQRRQAEKEWNKAVIDKLMAERYLARAGERGCRKNEAKLEPLCQQDQKFANELSDKIDCYVAYGKVIQAGTSKQKQQQNLKVLIRETLYDSDDLKVAEANLENANKLFNFFKNQGELNRHRHATLDKIFVIRNTASWQETMTVIRRIAYLALERAVNKCENDQEKIALLKKARTMPIFAEHRSNSIWAGAWGRTNTVATIDRQITQLRAKVKAEEKAQHVHGPEPMQRRQR